MPAGPSLWLSLGCSVISLLGLVAPCPLSARVASASTAGQLVFPALVWNNPEQLATKLKDQFSSTCKAFLTRRGQASLLFWSTTLEVSSHAKPTHICPWVAKQATDPSACRFLPALFGPSPSLNWITPKAVFHFANIE